MGSVYEEITRLEIAKADIETAIEGCGVNVPDTKLISDYALYIRQIPSAVFSDLDVGPFGGEDMYIKTIELKDGLITAATGGLVSSTSSGLVPKIGTSAASTISALDNEWVLTSTQGGSPTWRKLPDNAFENDNTNTTYALSGVLSANTYITTLTDSASGKTTATIPAMSGASSTAAGTAGLVPAPAANKHTAFLRGDGTWVVPTNYYRPISVNGTSILENNNTALNLVAGANISITAENSSGYTGKVTITNTGVHSTTINGNYLRVNTNGTNTDLTIPYATSAGSLGGVTISNFMVYVDNPNYVAASFTDENLSKKATEKYIEYWDRAGWFNSVWGQVTANYGFVGNLLGTATSAYYVFDYNSTTTPIYIGFTNTGLTSTTASYLAAYGTTSSGARCIKDISAAEAKKFIGLGNVQNTAFYKRVTTVNGTGWDMAGTNSNAAFTIYAPTTAGTSGLVLTSTGGTPGWTNQSSLSAGYLTIHSIRNNNYAPNSTSWPEFNIRAWFNNTGTPNGDWWSGITVKGWTNDYNVWLLASTATNHSYANFGLFFRTGNGSSWTNWKNVVTSESVNNIVVTTSLPSTKVNNTIYILV